MKPENEKTLGSIGNPSISKQWLLIGMITIVFSFQASLAQTQADMGEAAKFGVLSGG